MKLFYRGIQYQYSPLPVDLQEGEAMGKYRGRTYRVNRYPRHLPFPQDPLDLKYRGIDYKTHQCEEPIYSGLGLNKEASPMPSGITVETLETVEMAQAHCKNIIQSLEHRLQVAQAKGDRTLIHQLEREREEIYQGGFCSPSFQ